MYDIFEYYLDDELVAENEDFDVASNSFIEYIKLAGKQNQKQTHKVINVDSNVRTTKFYHSTHIKTKDNVNKPHHYVGDNGLEVEQVLQEFMPRYENAYVAHRIASAVEYVLRSPLKNGLEDLKKARKNLDQAIEYLEND